MTVENTTSFGKDYTAQSNSKSFYKQSYVWNITETDLEVNIQHVRRLSSKVLRPSVLDGTVGSFYRD